MDFLYSIWGLRNLLLTVQNFYFNFRYRKLNSKIRIFGYPIISIAKNSRFEIGQNLMLISSNYFSESGVNHSVVIRTLNKNAEIKIGNNVGISGGCICAASKIEIGDNVLIGANSSIIDTDFHPIDPVNRRFSNVNVQTKAIKISNNVFIGMNSIILKGVIIGENCVIGSGSIVTKNIPKNSIAIGNPCKVVIIKNWNLPNK